MRVFGRNAAIGYFARTGLAYVCPHCRGFRQTRKLEILTKIATGTVYNPNKQGFFSKNTDLEIVLPTQARVRLTEIMQAK